MITDEILKKIRKIEIKSKILSKYLSSGEYKSYFKGQGMSFSDVRNYQYGDEIRKIDWNVTARYHQPYLKLYEEEREQNVFFLIDSSKSMITGSESNTKIDFLLEIFTILSFSAESNKDKISTIIFSDKVEKFFPPKTGKKNILSIISTLLNHNYNSKSTNIESAINYLLRVAKKRSVVFIISDFITENSYYESLKILRKKHDVILIKIKDSYDFDFPNVGLIQFSSAENNDNFWINTNDKLAMNYLKDKLLLEQNSWSNFCDKEKISNLILDKNASYMPKLIKFFADR